LPDDDDDSGPPILRFPQSRTRPPGGGATPRFLGVGRLAEILGVPREQTTGHWCSRCRGIWFGYLLEVDCPACGNRHG
jgi:hypothetical protein